MIIKSSVTVALLLLSLTAFGVDSLKSSSCNDSKIASYGLAKYNPNKIGYVAPVYEGTKGIGMGKKLVGYFFSSGKDCKPNFKLTDKDKVFTRLAAKINGEDQDPCDQGVVRQKTYAVIEAAQEDHAGWKPVGNALSNPAHWAKKWNPDGNECTYIAQIKNINTCPSSCQSFIDGWEGGKAKFCNEFNDPKYYDSMKGCSSCCKK